jgi:hypothetical protein
LIKVLNLTSKKGDSLATYCQSIDYINQAPPDRPSALIRFTAE